MHHNKEKIKQKLREHDKMHFSKVKDSIARRDKFHTNLNDDEMRDKMM